MKTCAACGIDKPLSEYSVDKRRGNRPVTQCKPCKNTAIREAKAKNMDAVKAYNAKWREENKARRKEVNDRWTAENRGRLRETQKAWNKANPEKVAAKLERHRKSHLAKDNAKCAARRASRNQAIPRWADLTEIQDVHIEACYHGMQVDHIIPLRSKTVCGLHTVDNLQLLTAEANARKGNRYSHDWG